MHLYKSFKLLLLLTIISFSLYSLSSPSEFLTDDEQNSIKVFEENVRSVVNVSTMVKRKTGFFFGDFDEQESAAGAGSGFVWDNQGHIVTNFHVIQNGDKFQISFHHDKKVYEANLVGVEPKKDIAVLKLKELPPKMISVKKGTSANLKVGRKTLAIGNPFGLDHTMTVGVVSAVGRKVQGIGGVKIHDMIQTDAAINPGNSGGPLLNSQGQLIGMNTQILSSSGTSSGVGFAVPVNTIKQIVPQLIKYGKIIRPGLGIGVLPDHIKMRYGIEKGIIISQVNPEGPAAKAGLEGVGQDSWGHVYLGDIITKINGKEVNSYDDIYHVLDNYKVGDLVDVEYIRDEKKLKTKIKLMQL